MVYVRCEADGSFKSSVDKFYSQSDLSAWAAKCGAKPGDLLLLLSGTRKQTLSALCELRLEMGSRLGLRDHAKFAPLWVVDFPLLEWDDETQRFYAMHHPFTSPKFEDLGLFDTDPGKVRANAYDFVVNGVEVGGGSIRIFRLGITAQDVRSTRLQRRIGRRTVRVPDECVQIRRTAPRRHRFRLRPPFVHCSAAPIRSAITSPSRRTIRAAT